jgi:hypothetical protein
MRKILLGATLLFLPLTINAQILSDYVCSKFDGAVSEIDIDHSFKGDAFACYINNMWDVHIMSEINDSILNDQNITDSRSWRKVKVDDRYYLMRRLFIEADGIESLSIYVPFEQRTNQFIITE